MIQSVKIQSQIQFKKLLQLEWLLFSGFVCFFCSSVKANDKLNMVRHLSLQPKTQQVLVQKAIIKNHDTLVLQNTGTTVENNSFRGREASRKIAQYLLKGLWLNYKDQAYAFISHENEVDDLMQENPELSAQFSVYQNQLNYRVRVSKNRLMFKVRFDF